MDLRQRPYLLILFALLLTGCIEASIPPPPSAWTPAPGQSAEDAYQHWQAVQARETAAAVAPTQTAQAVTEGTRAAEMAALSTREAEVTKDYHDLAIEHERAMLQMTVDAATRIAGQEDALSTREAMAEAAQRQQEAANHAAMLRAAEERARAEYLRSVVSSGVWAFVAIAIVGTLAWLLGTLGYRWYVQARMAQRITAVETRPGVSGYITSDTNGNVTILQPRREEQDDSGNGNYPTPLQLSSRINGRLPDKAPWDRLIGWRDAGRLAIGVNTDSGLPVLIDRTRTPHLLAAGTTGAGKTTSILIPYLVGSYGAGDHVVIFNPKGADFNFADGWLNWTAVGMGRDELANVEPLVAFLKALRNEANRRGRVLAEQNVHNWASLPASAGESGQIVVAIDEFITMIRAAEIQTSIALAEGDQETAGYYKRLVIELWSQAFYLISQGRKYGIFVVATLTDPTNDALGKIGTEVKRQCARVAVNMQAAASSRTFLESGDDSCGLPYGRFMYNLGGQSGEAIAFHPSARDLRHYRQVREPNIKPNPLPELVAEAVEVAPGEYSVVNGSNGVHQPLFVAPAPDAAAVDGRQLEGVIEGMGSLNAVARELYQRDDTSGQDIEQRVVPALRWRITHLNCQRSKMILGRSSKYN